MSKLLHTSFNSRKSERGGGGGARAQTSCSAQCMQAKPMWAPGELTHCCGGAKTRIFVSQIDGFIISERSGTIHAHPNSTFLAIEYVLLCVLRPPRPRWQSSNAPPPPPQHHHHTPRPGRGGGENKKGILSLICGVCFTSKFRLNFDWDVIRLRQNHIKRDTFMT